MAGEDPRRMFDMSRATVGRDAGEEGGGDEMTEVFVLWGGGRWRVSEVWEGKFPKTVGQQGSGAAFCCYLFRWNFRRQAVIVKVNDMNIF